MFSTFILDAFLLIIYHEKYIYNQYLNLFVASLFIYSLFISGRSEKLKTILRNPLQARNHWLRGFCRLWKVQRRKRKTEGLFRLWHPEQPGHLPQGQKQNQLPKAETKRFRLRQSPQTKSVKTGCPGGQCGCFPVLTRNRKQKSRDETLSGRAQASRSPASPCREHFSGRSGSMAVYAPHSLPGILPDKNVCAPVGSSIFHAGYSVKAYRWVEEKGSLAVANPSSCLNHT